MGPLCDAEQFVRVPTVVGPTVDARRNTSVAALHTNEPTLCNNNNMATKNSRFQVFVAADIIFCLTAFIIQPIYYQDLEKQSTVVMRI